MVVVNYGATEAQLPPAPRQMKKALTISAVAALALMAVVAVAISSLASTEHEAKLLQVQAVKAHIKMFTDARSGMKLLHSARGGMKPLHSAKSLFQAKMSTHLPGVSPAPADKDAGLDALAGELRTVGTDAAHDQIAYGSVCQAQRADLENQVEQGCDAEDWHCQFAIEGVYPIYKVIDTDESGCIDPGEFETFVIMLQTHLPAEDCAAALAMVCSDLKDAHGAPDHEKIDDLFYSIDTDHSGLLSFNEVVDEVYEAWTK